MSPYIMEYLTSGGGENKMTYSKRFTTAIATGAVLINALAPVAFAETITVSGNGSLSNNTVNVSSNTTTSVNQSNNANVINNVTSNASTGGNSTNFNTGGNTTIQTGNATTNTTVSTAANLNSASVNSCGTCGNGATNVTVSGNGYGSSNGVDVNNSNGVFLNQTNNANVLNSVESKANTGKNDSSFNTGGNGSIVTGNASTTVKVGNMLNANEATVGGGNGNAGNSSVTITGNGAFSENGVALNNGSAVVLSQGNSANVANYVDAKANTGKNDSTFNTGGDTSVVTGNAKTDVTVDNAVNFNSASVGCDCVMGGLEVKVAGNGTDSFNAVDAGDDNAVFNGQGNETALLNSVDGNAKTGYNDPSFNTSEVNGDPSVHTGNGTSTTNVDNSGNVNLFNNGSTLHLPGDVELGLNFDLFGLWTNFSHLFV